MAEGILRDLAARREWEIEVMSAGVWAPRKPNATGAAEVSIKSSGEGMALNLIPSASSMKSPVPA